MHKFILFIENLQLIHRDSLCWKLSYLPVNNTTKLKKFVELVVTFHLAADDCLCIVLLPELTERHVHHVLIKLVTKFILGYCLLRSESVLEHEIDEIFKHISTFKLYVFIYSDPAIGNACDSCDDRIPPYRKPVSFKRLVLKICMH